MDLLTISEVATLLRVPRSWIYARTSDPGKGRIPFLRLGRHLRFSRAAIERWVALQAAKTAGNEPEGRR